MQDNRPAPSLSELFCDIRGVTIAVKSNEIVWKAITSMRLQLKHIAGIVIEVHLQICYQ